jgi:hypothetical protein
MLVTATLQKDQRVESSYQQSTGESSKKDAETATVKAAAEADAGLCADGARMANVLRNMK